MGSAYTKIGDFKISKDKLGNGQFGEVYKGELVATGEEIAIKKCPLIKHDAREMAIKEIKALEHVPKHDNIVHVVGYTFHENFAYIAMEFCNLGDMEHYAKRKRFFNVKEKVSIMYQCACGLNTMHTLKTPVAHRDLKPQNVLFKMENGEPVAKIGDFGLAKVVDDNTLLKTVMGTMLYMAPEMFKGHNYTTAVDVFAMGLMYLALLRFEELGELLPLPEKTNDISKAQAYGMKIAAIGGLFGKDIGIEFIVKKPTDNDDVKVLKSVIDAMLQAVPRQRIKMQEVKAALAGILGLAEPSVPTVSKDSDDDGDDMAGLMRRMGIGGTKRTSGFSDDDESGGASGGLGGLMGLLAQLEKGIDRRRAGLTTRTSKFKLGERVCVYPELDVVKKAQEDHGGWNEKMECTLGQAGFVDKQLGPDVYGVRFDDGNRFAYNAEVLHIVVDEEAHPTGAGSPLRYLDVVVVEKDLKTLKKYQQEKGDWNGKVAMHAWTCWEKLIKQVTPPPRTPEQLALELQIQLGNIPQTKIQKLIRSMGHKSAGQKGVVHRMHTDGTITVECHMQETLNFNANSLTKVDPSTFQFSKGDLVLVKMDRRAVIDALGETPGWAEPMQKCLGESGQILEMRSPTIAKVEINDNTWKWHTGCLILIGKRDELAKAAMLKKTTTDLVSKIAESMLKK